MVLTPAFAVLLLLGLAQAAATLWRAADPSAAGLVAALTEAFRLAPVVTAVFFAGELWWSERERGMDALVADGRLAGLSVLVYRRGQVAYRRCAGMADRERGTAMADDTIVRIYSMTIDEALRLDDDTQ